MTRSLSPFAVLVAPVALLSLVVAGLAAQPAAGDPAAARHHHSKGSAKWSGTSFVAGLGEVKVRGSIPGGRRRVQLQVHIKGGWRTLEATRTKRNGHYKLHSALAWYGTHKVRVHAAGRPGFSSSRKIEVSTGYVPPGSASDYDLLMGRTVAQNWRFNPCRVLRYKVNANEVGPAGVLLAEQAMAQVSFATGIRVKYTGTTSFIPEPHPHARLPKRTNLVIAWASHAEVPDFVTRDAEGLSGPRKGVYARNSKGQRVVATTQAGVTLVTDSFFYYAPAFASTIVPSGHLLLHEIGHAMGLDHAAGSDEMMYGAAWTPDADGVYRSVYHAGDLTGMSKVGLEQGCLRPLRSRPGERLAPPVAPIPVP